MPPRLLTRRQWLSAAGLLAAGCAGRPAEEPIWVGHLGPPGERTESAIHGMQQTLADLHEKKFAVSGRPLGVRHVEAKDKSRARAEASRLLAVNRVACLIVGPELEGVGEVCAVARAHGSIAVVLGGTDDRALAQQAVWLGVGPEKARATLARYAASKGHEPVAIRKDRSGQFYFSSGNAGPSREVWTLRLVPDSADGRAWTGRYETRFGVPPSDDAVLGADAVAFIADGLKAVGGDDRRRLAAELDDRTTFAGLAGPIEWRDWRTIRRMGVERVVDGKRVAVDPVSD